MFTKIIFDGDAYYNNEPFWMRMHDLDWAAMMEKAGFEPDRVMVAGVPVQMYMRPTPENPEGGWMPCRFALSVMAATVAPS